MQDHALNLKVSRFYLYGWAVFTGLTLIIIAILSFSFLMKFILAGISISYCYFILKKYILLQSGISIVSLLYQQKSGWILGSRSQHFNATLLGSSTVTRWVSIMRFKVKEKKFPVNCIIFRDSLSESDYRKLILYAKFG